MFFMNISRGPEFIALHSSNSNGVRLHGNTSKHVKHTGEKGGANQEKQL